MMPGESHFRVGEIDITRLTEIAYVDFFTPAFLFPDWSEEKAAAHRTALTPGALRPGGEFLVVNINSWIVRTQHHTIIVDTGIGDGRTRRIAPFHNLQTGYLDRLIAAGVDPKGVDYVLCTHVHSDHVGWNTQWVDGAWVPTFPNARYLWSAKDNDIAATPEFRGSLAAGVYEDSVLPILKSGQFDAVGNEGGEVLDGIAFHPTPGHTPGHMSITFRSGNEQALFTGDTLHNPFQVFFPEWNSAFCEEHELARKSRRWVLEYAAEHRALFLPAHFGGSSAGYVTRKGEDFHWTFA